MAEPGTRVFVYEYGEAHDDLRAAFYIDERTYNDPGLADAVVQAAETAMDLTGVIYAVEVTGGQYAVVPVGVPTWDDFRQRHFVDGVPLPVRPPSDKTPVPGSWDSMNRAIGEAHRAFRDELSGLMSRALPDRKVHVTRDYGPIRRSPASIDWGDEKYGFEILLRAKNDGVAFDRLTDVLRVNGWRVVVENDDVLSADRDDGYDLWIAVDGTHLDIVSRSPLYRAAEPDFVIEPRDPD